MLERLAILGRIRAGRKKWLDVADGRESESAFGVVMDREGLACAFMRHKLGSAEDTCSVGHN